MQSTVIPILCEAEFAIENPWLVALIALAILAVVGFFVFSMVKGLKGFSGAVMDLHALMRKTAQQLELEYDSDPTVHANLTDKLRQFALTGSHSAERFYRQLSGEIAQPGGSRPIVFFDFTSKQQPKFTIRQTVLLVETNASRLPALQLTPTRLADRFAEIAGAQDIDLQNDAEFSRKFSVKGADEMEIRVALTTGITGFFKNHPDFSFESSGGGAFLLYRDGCFAEGKTVEAMQSAYRIQLDCGLELASLIESGQ